ncbi:MAG: CDP-diacylglycerol--glycerol-3-phosphate 3-phosphatidyltransferase [Halobacteriovoraceae bacterium]|nr:CDP-diacylglycerol--glycerol-3-phosphate 3-phosphatidyltransferase [Halobacteriovoraceae bacterium]
METAAPPNNEWEINNLPNKLTIFRVCLIPVIIVCLILNLTEFSWILDKKVTFGYIAGWTFVAASITDFLDGYIARKRKIVTVFGSFIDPIADKFLVVSSLIMLLALERLNVIVVIILVLREIYITALRLLAIERGVTLPVANLAKWKTAFQMIGIPMLMPNDQPWGLPMPITGKICVYLAALISVYSAMQYSLGLVRKLKEERKKKQELKKDKKEQENELRKEKDIEEQQTNPSSESES